jgi:hypothetical protein
MKGRSSSRSSDRASYPRQNCLLLHVTTLHRVSSPTCHATIRLPACPSSRHWNAARERWCEPIEPARRRVGDQCRGWCGSRRSLARHSTRANPAGPGHAGMGGMGHPCRGSCAGAPRDLCAIDRLPAFAGGPCLAPRFWYADSQKIS